MIELGAKEMAFLLVFVMNLQLAEELRTARAIILVLQRNMNFFG
jgi:hypothetical protein